jgi:hypothetical protein
MIAVELARDFDHLIDGLHVAGGHRTVGDEHRLVQAADLELDEFVRRIDGALARIAALRSRAHLHDIPSLAAISSMVTPAASFSMSLRSRFASSRFVTRRRLEPSRLIWVVSISSS